jgi:F0F1-type ATP synthase assembly protein I
MIRLAVILILAVVPGVGLGLLIDGQLGSRPWGILILSVAGMILGSILGFRLVAAAIAEAEVAAVAARARRDARATSPRVEE